MPSPRIPPPGASLPPQSPTLPPRPREAARPVKLVLQSPDKADEKKVRISSASDAQSEGRSGGEKVLERVSSIASDRSTPRHTRTRSDPTRASSTLNTARLRTRMMRTIPASRLMPETGKGYARLGDGPRKDKEITRSPPSSRRHAGRPKLHSFVIRSFKRRAHRCPNICLAHCLVAWVDCAVVQHRSEICHQRFEQPVEDDN